MVHGAPPAASPPGESPPAVSPANVLPPVPEGPNFNGITGVPGFMGVVCRARACCVGEGKNRWPAVHRHDAPPQFRQALEKGTAGSRYHGVAEEGVAIRDIAEVVGKRLNVPAVSKSAEEVAGALGFVGQVLAMDAPASSKLTQERLGWRPAQPGLIADLEKGTYFDAKASPR